LSFFIAAKGGKGAFFFFFFCLLRSQIFGLFFTLLADLVFMDLIHFFDFLDLILACKLSFLIKGF